MSFLEAFNGLTLVITLTLIAACWLMMLAHKESQRLQKENEHLRCTIVDLVEYSIEQWELLNPEGQTAVIESNIESLEDKLHAIIDEFDEANH